MSFTKEEIAARGHPVWAEIDLDAIRHNVSVLRRMASSSELMGVVKGYAYGHGNPESALAMIDAGATRIGVARVAEAIHLREAGVEVPIHVFTEPPPVAAPTMVDLRLTATVYTAPFAAALSEAASEAGARLRVHVKLDTGMHRVGLPPDEALDAVTLISKLPGLSIEGAWSHLAVADVPDHPFTRKQLALFSELTDRIERGGLRLRYRHIANSAATMSLPEARLDLVRCGIACFGLWPGPAFADTSDLRPALALKARVNLVKAVPEGEAVSYGLEYKVPRDVSVVTVPAGYADGYDRRLSGRAPIVIDGGRYVVSGTVCMDQFMVDVGSDEVEVGDTATLIGEGITAEELADIIGTINYEVTTRIPSRVPRVFLNTSGGLGRSDPASGGLGRSDPE
ncbi:MAG TPA: alanine racemase [Actinomycetota bacterium]|nr:alanine racemase [Actinomycetota bacterium]